VKAFRDGKKILVAVDQPPIIGRDAKRQMDRNDPAQEFGNAPPAAVAFTLQILNPLSSLPSSRISSIRTLPTQDW